MSQQDKDTGFAEFEDKSEEEGAVEGAEDSLASVEKAASDGQSGGMITELGEGLTHISIITPDGNETCLDVNSFIIVGGNVDYTHDNGKKGFPLLNTTMVAAVAHPYVAFELVTYLLNNMIMPWWKTHVDRMLRSTGLMLPLPKEKDDGGGEKAE